MAIGIVVYKCFLNCDLSYENEKYIMKENIIYFLCSIEELKELEMNPEKLMQLIFDDDLVSKYSFI